MIDDFHVTNPLFKNKTGQVHGWEIDGVVSIDKNVLEFGMGKQGQYIIKNFIPIVSENIKYEIDMDIQLSS